VTIADVRHTLERLSTSQEEDVRRFGELCKRYEAEGRWTFQSSPYWCNPWPIWELPEALRSQFRESNLVIFQGDALSRRVHGDLRWPIQTPLAEIASDFPTNLLLVRTLKSEHASGMTDNGFNDELSKKHAGFSWLSNGEYGVIQFLKAERR